MISSARSLPFGIRLFRLVLSSLAAIIVFAASASAADKKIVLIAGKPSHGPGEHEFRAGCLLLQKCLAGVSGVTTEVCDNGWPKANSMLDGAAAVVLYA